MEREKQEVQKKEGEKERTAEREKERERERQCRAELKEEVNNESYKGKILRTNESQINCAVREGVMKDSDGK